MLLIFVTFFLPVKEEEIFLWLHVGVKLNLRYYVVCKDILLTKRIVFQRMCSHC